MSGGLDSTSVAALVVDVRGRDAARCQAVTAVYDTLFEDEERHYSSLAADALGMPIRHLPVDGYGLFERWAGDSLPPEPSTEVLWAVTRDVLAAAGPHSDVALSGDGGDPVLLPGAVVRQAGRVPVAQLAAGAWRTLRRGLWPPLGLRSGLVRRRRTDRIEMPTWLSPRLSRLHDFRSRWEGFYDGLAPLDAPRGEALASLRGQWWAPAFELSDPNTTGVPVEPSYPFFDSRVVSVALSLPSYPWCVNKTVLRDAMSGHLPDAVRLRPKAPLAGDPVASRAWSSAALMQRLRSTPRIDAYVDLAEIERRCTGEGLFSDRQPGTLAVAALATWLRADARSSP
jgi:asparagine synthase (glutamine-hydrolysing)